MITVELKGDRIWLRADRPIAGLGKVVPGSRFSMVDGAHWSIPLTMDACRALRQQFGRELKVRDDLSDWARTAIERETKMTALGTAADAVLRRVPEISPVLASAMASRTYQRVGARFIAEGGHDGGVLIADQPGLGKTLEAIGGIIESGVPGPYLVVCPKTAVETVWAAEIPRWWPGQNVITVPDGRTRRDDILDEAVRGFDSVQRGELPHLNWISNLWAVVHPEMMRTKSWRICKQCGERTRYRTGPIRLNCEHEPTGATTLDEHTFPQLFAIEWGAIIADESDRMLLRPTGTPTQTRRGAELLRVREADGLKIAMSGTPFRGRPHLLWGTLNWLRPKAYSGFWRWAETFYQVNIGWGGSRSISTLIPEKEGELDRSLNVVMLRRTKAEVAPDMPAKTYVGTPLVPGDERSPVGVWLPMDPAQRKLYDQISKESVASMIGGELNAIGILAELTRLKQFATTAGRLITKEDRDGISFQEFEPALPSNKFEYLAEYLHELGFPDDPETKVVIASQFTKLLNLFARELTERKIGRCCMLTGEVTGVRRKQTIADFNQPVDADTDSVLPNIMLLNIKAGGVAITIDSADHMFFIDETYIPDDQEQTEDRIHRVSKPRPVFYHYLRSAGSVDESIALSNAERAGLTHGILDGRRGLEFARKVVERLR